MTAAELDARPTEAPCPDCRGLGEVLVHEHASAPAIDPPEEVKDCETCDATGRVDARCNDCSEVVEACACEAEEPTAGDGPLTWRCEMCGRSFGDLRGCACRSAARVVAPQPASKRTQ